MSTTPRVHAPHRARHRSPRRSAHLPSCTWRTVQVALVTVALVVTGALAALAPAAVGPKPVPVAPGAPVQLRLASAATDDVAPVTTTRARATATRRTSGSAALRRLQRRMLTVVNVARAVPQTCGSKLLPAVGPLTINKRVTRAAQGYARKMARNDWFDHDAPDGTDPGERIEAEGYRWSRWGENIGAGYDGVLGVVAAWLESPGHCRTLMGGGFRHVGFGHAYAKGSTYGHYWVQDFASPK